MNSAEKHENEELLNLCAKRDEKGWKRFVERFGPLVAWSIRDKIGRENIPLGSSDIDDIIQQTFSHIWHRDRLKDLKNPRSISAWLVIVTHNITSDFVRKNRPSARFLPPEELSESIADTGADPRAETDNKQLHEAVEGMVADLPIKERRIMTLELFYDLKHREIAGIMGIPVNTVSTIIVRIKKDLRERLKRRGYHV